MMSPLKSARKKTNSARPKPAANEASAMKWISRGEKSNTSLEGEGSVQTSNSGKQMAEGEGFS